MRGKLERGNAWGTGQLAVFDKLIFFWGGYICFGFFFCGVVVFGCFQKSGLYFEGVVFEYFLNYGFCFCEFFQSTGR